MRKRTRSDSDQRGQAMVEFAVILPCLCLLLVGVLQFGIVLNDYLDVTSAARAGARKASVCADCSDGVGEAISAAQDANGTLDSSKLQVSVSPGQPWATDDHVTVTTRYPFRIHLLGIVVASGNLTARANARVE